MLSKYISFDVICFRHFFKKIALCFALLPSEAEPTERTKQPLPPFLYILYMSIVKNSVSKVPFYFLLFFHDY